jgi:hypothetical protein
VFVLVLGALNGGDVTAEEVFFVPLVLLAVMTSGTVGFNGTWTPLDRNS